MGDSVISATDNKVWREQRNHLVEAFLPTSSLAKIFPVSVDRAEACAEILKRLSQGEFLPKPLPLPMPMAHDKVVSLSFGAGGTEKVNMTEFFLNETQQQLHLVRPLHLCLAACRVPRLAPGLA